MAEATPTESRPSFACFSTCRWCGGKVQRDSMVSSTWYHRIQKGGHAKTMCEATDLSAHFVKLVQLRIATADAYDEDTHMDGAPKQFRWGERQRALEELADWCVENVEFVVRNG